MLIFRSAGDRQTAALSKLRDVAPADENIMPALIQQAEAEATVGEMINTLKDVYGAYDGARRCDDVGDRSPTGRLTASWRCSMS